MTRVPVLGLDKCGPLMVTPMNLGVLILSANSIASSFPNVHTSNSKTVCKTTAVSIGIFFYFFFFLPEFRMLSMDNSHCKLSHKAIKLFEWAGNVYIFCSKFLLHIVRYSNGSTSVFNNLISSFFFQNIFIINFELPSLYQHIHTINESLSLIFMEEPVLMKMFSYVILI